MPDLDEQIRGFIDSGATPVSAHEVMGRAPSDHEVPSPIWSPRTSRVQRRIAWAWLSLVVILVVVLVVAVRIASTSSGVRPASPAPDEVNLAVTPTGWVPIDFGDAQNLRASELGHHSGGLSSTKRQPLHRGCWRDPRGGSVWSGRKLSDDYPKHQLSASES